MLRSEFGTVSHHHVQHTLLDNEGSDQIYDICAADSLGAGQSVICCVNYDRHIGFGIWENECVGWNDGTLHYRHVPFRNPENHYRVYAVALSMLAAACCEM